ncbi:MAG: putative Ig domain-containing protein, partial [Caldilineaceae bacterium]|nr:putative Ig domain-containing protein [Caldilineaceae bacterium]
MGLPAGLTLNATTGAISGTPTATGNATITATYEGPGGEQCQGSTTLAVTAAPCPAITVSPASLPNGTVGTPYSSSVSASGGTAPYTFAVTSGALPAGLSLNGSTGAITGTPTSTTAANFTISVTDDNGCPGSASFTVTPACPVITVTPNPLSSGTVGTAYTASPSVSGGIAPYTWTATGLPAGLSINPSTGAISGTPTAAGSTTITAIDSNGCSGTSTLNVAGPALLSCGMAVGTCASDIDFSASSNNYFKSDGYVVGIMDIRQPPAPSPSTNWMPPIYHNPDWVYGALNSSTGLTDGLGGVFGIAIDNSKNIYLTAFKPYSPNGTSATAAAPGFGGPGAVYKLDASTGAVSLFASLPQSALPGAPMLGNIAYDGENDQFFASNFEDGKIYQLNSSGTIGSSFDPGTPDDSTPGVVATGERVWGIGYYQGRVYYAVWSTGLTNEIRSVAVDSGGNFSDDRSEFTLPMSSNTSSRQTPIADIEFASDGAMLLVERTMDGTAFQSQAHYSKSYEFTYTSGSWNQTHVYYVGDYAGLNTGIRTHAAGGGDYGYTSVDPLTNIGTGEDSRVWLSGDTLKYASGNYIFGFQGIPRDPSNLQTDPTANANLIDANGDTSIIDKYGIGDIDICRPCATAPCPAVAVSPATLPNGTVGTAYSATVSASGGTAPYTFAVTSGALPAGLSLNGSTGAITGTPTSTTAANFTISVTDDNGCPGSASFTVTPACPVITVTPNPLSSGTVGTAYSASPSASGGI